MKQCARAIFYLKKKSRRAWFDNSSVKMNQRRRSSWMQSVNCACCRWESIHLYSPFKGLGAEDKGNRFPGSLEFKVKNGRWCTKENVMSKPTLLMVASNVPSPRRILRYRLHIDAFILMIDYTVLIALIITICIHKN